jgi:hypothetical protein
MRLTNPLEQEDRMGAVKRMMEELETKRAAAGKIALDAGVLKNCEFHDYLFEGDSDIEAAYRLGNHRFSAGSLEDVFENRRDMTDIIKEVVQDSPDECPICAKIRDE